MSNVVSNESYIAFHPGYYVGEYLKHQGMKQSELAERLGVSEKTVSHLINGKNKRLSPELINGLALVLGTSKELWVNLNDKYLEMLEKIDADNRLTEEKEVFSNMDYMFWVRNGFVERKKSKSEKIEELKRFFKISSLSILKKKDFLVQYRTTVAKVHEKNVINANAWVQTALNMGNMVNVEQVNLNYLESKIDDIRKMTLQAPEEFLPTLMEIFRKSGVAFVMVPNLKNCGVNGAVKWLGKDKVLLALNDRRKFSDVFWFSLFHELKHVFQQRKSCIIVSMDGRDEEESDMKVLENEADNFARDTLIAPKQYAEFIEKSNFSYDSIKSFADQIEIQPGIVVGRLQKEGYLNYNQFNDLKQKYIIVVNHEDN